MIIFNISLVSCFKGTELTEKVGTIKEFSELKTLVIDFGENEEVLKNIDSGQDILIHIGNEVPVSYSNGKLKKIDLFYGNFNSKRFDELNYIKNPLKENFDEMINEKIAISIGTRSAVERIVKRAFEDSNQQYIFGILEKVDYDYVYINGSKYRLDEITYLIYE